MSLVIFTALVGMLCAPVSAHPVVAFASLLCIAVGAGASGALNMWWDADIDAKMKRTQKRPIPSGAVTGEEALGLGLGLSVMSVVMLAVFAGPLAALLLAFTIWFYAMPYTMWLKRSTPHNIVIGGAAGAFPPLVGWVAVTGSVSIEPILMFGIIFLWTPPHFWALALWRRSEYAIAEVPMLPVVSGTDVTRKQIFIYSVLLALSSIGLLFTPVGGPIYAGAALAMNAWFLHWAWMVLRRNDDQAELDNFAAEKKLFGVSIYYLAVIFFALLLDALLRVVTG
ncbi:UNVERIFIED_CONTAM: hypothetical protein GTU68_007582 [Idotea baltica]|nr:hypothetical protein [Idotea baltica]